jgi:hypothetical protein
LEHAQKLRGNTFDDKKKPKNFQQKRNKLAKKSFLKLDFDDERLSQASMEIEQNLKLIKQMSLEAPKEPPKRLKSKIQRNTSLNEEVKERNWSTQKNMPKINILNASGSDNHFSSRNRIPKFVSSKEFPFKQPSARISMSEATVSELMKRDPTLLSVEDKKRIERW